MTVNSSGEKLAIVLESTRATLLGARSLAGHWLGELSTSALSTATAVSALALVQRQSTRNESLQKLIPPGIAWLVHHQNPDGGWGDTTLSLSNISTSMLVWAAFHLTDSTAQHPQCIQRLHAYVHQHCGKTAAEQAEAIRARYGKDRTFAVPILTTCALAGLIPWSEVAPLPFELACFPQSWFRFLRLPVVSYALPALIAIGQAVHRHRPPRNPLVRLIRRVAVNRSLRVLEAIQPSSGGFLEATPLTSFVTLSLASIGQADHPVARKGIEFLVKSVRPDGSWPIDSNLATWVTTLSINALASGGCLDNLDRREELTEWLLTQQFKGRHAYTGADPGGWGWTDLPGSVPDADDTAGAILSLACLTRVEPLTPNPSSPRGEGSKDRVAPAGEGSDDSLMPPFHMTKKLQGIDAALSDAVMWLIKLQNRDGGWPTFCKGWGNLPFDRSGADLTAHALRALAAHTRRAYASTLACSKASANGLAYLARIQRHDGSWLPLWFGNQHCHDDENPTYGTARVLAAYRDLDMMNSEPAQRGVGWLVTAQNDDGGWGGSRGAPSTMEETALAVDVLLDGGREAAEAVNRGLAWLVQGVESGALQRPAPIGFYFAKLWYFEKLYPIIFTVSALGRACKKDVLPQPQQPSSSTP